tara:strand:+ start:7333 stop:9282 length:1950 start_codon:yes stop_codon:yes gene_type:complete
MSKLFKAVTRPFVKAAKAIVKGFTNVVSGLVSAITSPFGANIDVPDYDIGTDQAEAIQGVLLNKDSAISHIPVVYGTRKVGGTRVFVSTDGTNNKYLYLAFVMAEGQINAFQKFFVDDNEVTLSSYTHGTVATPTGGDYKDKIKIQFFDGRDTQVSSSILSETPNWTSDHRLSGIAYLAIRFEWTGFNTDTNPNNNPFGGGIPVVQAQIQGRKVYDATTLTADSTTSHDTAYEDEPTTFTNNPVSCLLDYMRNSRYGKGLANSSFNFDTWKTAADLCDQTVTYTNGTTSKAFTCDAVLDTKNSLMVNIKIILAGFRGMLPYQAGKYKCKIEHGGDDTDISATPSDPTTVFTVTADHLIGGLRLEGESKQHKANRVVVTYVDPEADFQPNDVTFPEEGSADDIAFLADDNNIRLEKRITLPTITNRSIAEQYARVFLRRSRNQKYVSFNTNLATSNTSVGDLIRVQSDTIGLDGIFRIMDMRINSRGDIQIDGIEHQSSTYAISASGDDYVRPTLNLPDPFQVIAPTGLTVQSGNQFDLTDSNGNVTNRLSVSYTASTDPFLSDYIIQYKRSSDANFTTFSQTAETFAFVSPVVFGDSYDVRVAARNQLNRRSGFVTVLNHTVSNTFQPSTGSSSTQSGSGSTTNVNFNP